MLMPTQGLYGHAIFAVTLYILAAAGCQSREQAPANMHNRSVKQKSYYKSFVSYKIPLVLKDAVAFEDTKGLSSYYIGYYDDNGQLVRVAKILLQRVTKQEVDLAAKRAPGTLVFFAANRDDAGTPGQGDELSYAETESLEEYWQGQVAATGDRAELSLLRRTMFFDDTYSYWESGALKRRVLSKSDGSKSTWEFDEQGRQQFHSVERQEP